MASSAANGSSSEAAVRKEGRGVTTTDASRGPSVARARLAAAGGGGGGGLHRDMGWVGVRARLWGGYAAEIRIPSSRKRVWIGRFQHAVQAALAYDAAMFLFYGKTLPKLRRYNFPEAPRPCFPEFVRRALTIANVKAIAEEHARSVGRFFAPLPPPSVILAPAPPPAAAAAPAPLQVAEAAAGGASAAGVGVAVIEAAAGVGVAVEAAAAAGAGVAIDIAPAAGVGVAVEAAAAAGAGVAVDIADPAAGVGATTTTADDKLVNDDEIYIDADILTSADCQFSGPPVPDEDFVRLMDLDDLDLIFGDI